jgi:hypothetical protein
MPNKENKTKKPKNKQMNKNHHVISSNSVKIHLQKLLGHAVASTLVEDVGTGENELEDDDHADEKAHARCCSGYHW